MIEPDSLINFLKDKEWCDCTEMVADEPTRNVYNWTIMIPSSSKCQSLNEIKSQILSILNNVGYYEVSDLQRQFETGMGDTASSRMITPYEKLVFGASGNPLKVIEQFDEAYILYIMVNLTAGGGIYYSVEITEGTGDGFDYFLYFNHGSEELSKGKKGVKFRGKPECLIRVMHYLVEPEEPVFLIDLSRSLLNHSLAFKQPI